MCWTHYALARSVVNFKGDSLNRAAWKLLPCLRMVAQHRLKGQAAACCGLASPTHHSAQVLLDQLGELVHGLADAHEQHPGPTELLLEGGGHRD